MHIKGRFFHLGAFMETQKLELVRLPEDPSREIMVGIDGEISVTDNIANAVERSERLFPYVVHHIAKNRMQSDEEFYASSHSKPIQEQMREVRDELNVCLRSIRHARRIKLQQAQNITINVRPVRQPYFVR